MTTTTILSGASLSSVVSLPEGMFLSGVQIPSAWTTANLTFQVSIDGATYTDVYDSFGSEITVTVGGASRFVNLIPQEWAGFRHFKIRSGTTGTPVNQAGDRTLNLSISNFA